jgi:hypothetical protein
VDNENKMDEHALDLIRLLLWLTGILGSGFVGGLIWFGRSVVTRLSRIEELLSSETKALRELFHGVDKRVIAIEMRHASIDNHQGRP